VGSRPCAFLFLALVGVFFGAIGHRVDTSIHAMIGGRGFRLELAHDAESHRRGLGGRTWLTQDRGMLFVFARSDTRLFTMRDCAIALDLLYLDRSRRVIDVYAMEPEPPRSSADASDEAYMARLHGYISSMPARYAVEIAGGMASELGVRRGDVVEFDADGLE